MIILLLTATLLLCDCSQTVDSLSVSKSEYNYDNRHGSNINIIEYFIQNNTDEVFLTWLDFDFQQKRHMSKAKSISSFFAKPKGDFNLFSLFGDNVRIQENLPLEIGFNLFVEILPGESFSYITINDTILLDRFIVTAPKDWVKCNIIDISDQFIYKGHSIVIA